jgi:hypothetical protein
MQGPTTTTTLSIKEGDYIKKDEVVLNYWIRIKFGLSLMLYRVIVVW